jgi:hypothetical protein
MRSGEAAMRNAERRLERLERRYIRHLVADTAREYSIDVDEFVEDIWRFCALADDEQDREFATSIAEAEARGDTDDVRILRDGWAAIRSYR